MAPRSPIGATRRLKDPSKLTPGEEKIYALMREGKNYKEIAQAIGVKNIAGINSRVLLIREKLGHDHG